ncbi:MAG: DUF448 domain-containing protein [Actinobacteria bacterium]|nr:DUF448 domain-containing protein [Actinomycetota bacterium]MSX99854.1 DUF448 domain-containing protein [Actinomycetota bacterium]MTA49551.1 DUF448 domain-containing protein [Actinomycetota bacterium]MTA91496.1 DUF448 domain-containing protein [Actinomycetota bacterium]
MVREMAAMQISIKPIRTCIVCRKSQEPSQLLRVNCVAGVVTPTIGRKSHGRGAWLHLQCGYIAIDRKAFKSAFKLEQSPDTSKFKAFLDEHLKVEN